MLTTSQIQLWTDNGYLVLPAFFSKPRVSAMRRLHDRMWEERPPGIVAYSLRTGRGSHIDKLGPEAEGDRFKVSDLYLKQADMRAMALDSRLVPALRQLLGDDPVLCNSLSMDYGSQQPLHIDSLFLTPETDNVLVAV